MSAAPVKVSVIVPVYNVEDYLPKCLESCISQTLYDIEIICVNDGSTDGSPAILEQYRSIDPRIRVINQKNKGLAGARNTGLNAANGKWIMFLDSDDYLSENACERVWEEGEEGKTDIIVFGTNIVPSYPAADGWYYSVLNVSTRRFHEFTPDVLFRTPGAKPFVWRQAFSSEFLEKTGIQFYEMARYGEDLLFQMETFPNAEEFSFIQDALYNYRWRREGSLMSQMDGHLDYKMEQHLQMIEWLTTYWNDNGLLEKYGNDYLKWLLDFMVNDLREEERTDRTKHAETLRDIISQFGLEAYKEGFSKEDERKWKLLYKM